MLRRHADRAVHGYLRKATPGTRTRQMIPCPGTNCPVSTKSMGYELLEVLRAAGLCSRRKVSDASAHSAAT